MAKVRISARSNSVGAPFWTGDQIREHHDGLLSAHLPRHGFLSQVSWVDDLALIVAEYEADRSSGDGPALAAADTAVQLVQQIGLGVVEATVTDTIRGWAATGPLGALGGWGITKDASAGVQIAGLTIGGILAGLAGLFVRVEVPIYRLSSDEFGRWTWVSVAPGSAAPLGVYFAQG